MATIRCTATLHSVAIDRVAGTIAVALALPHNHANHGKNGILEINLKNKLASKMMDHPTMIAAAQNAVDTRLTQISFEIDESGSIRFTEFNPVMTAHDKRFAHLKSIEKKFIRHGSPIKI